MTARSKGDYTMPKQEKVTKASYFAFLVYHKDKDGEVLITEEELHFRLRRSFMMFAVSPLHQPDEDNDGEHWHVIYKHPGPIHFDGARKIITNLSGVPVYNDFVLLLHSPAVYMRYLVHLDNPEKEQFVGGPNCVEVINGFPYDILRSLTASQQQEIQLEIESFALEYNIFEYGRMTNYLSEHGLYEHHRYFTNHTHHFGKYLDSLRHDAEHGRETSLDA